MENVKVEFESRQFSNLQLALNKKRKMRVEIPRHGDLINKMYLVVRILMFILTLLIIVYSKVRYFMILIGLKI